ncbi:preprotein translocase subunit SecG [Anderseniella sp. Alg231-50]|uniref:preprotein translocase subunit SecG n=1 Tax=Anderseniella sp. Alg231-50 TaxID=1922226 RepID=UPI000D55349A
MIAVITVVHLLIVMALIGVVLMQRSEGGALGIGGGGGGGGGMFTSRGAGSALTKTTAILAVCFFVTSLSLAYLSRGDSGGSSVLDQVAPTQSQGGQDGDGRSVLPTLPGTPPAPTEPAVPTQ